jgi:hypothetical protein
MTLVITDFVARINDVDEDNSPDNAQSKEEEAESSISTEVREEYDNGEEFTPTVDGESEEGDKTQLEGSQYRYPQQQHIVNNGEETEVAHFFLFLFADVVLSCSYCKPFFIC